MPSFSEYMREYKQQLHKGVIQKAYRGLMDYVTNLQRHFAKAHPEYGAAGGIYFGYMDMTYFALFPEALKARKLKVAVVFVHETCRFEVWLVGVNRQVQAQYHKLIQASGWENYHLETPAPGVDAIVDHVLVEEPDFGDLDALTAEIERGMLAFIQDVEGLLVRLES